MGEEILRLPRLRAHGVKVGRLGCKRPHGALSPSRAQIPTLDASSLAAV